MQQQAHRDDQMSSQNLIKYQMFPQIISQFEESFEKFTKFIKQTSSQQNDAILQLAQLRIKKMIKNKKIKKNWGKDQRKILVHVTDMMIKVQSQKTGNNLEQKDWRLISSLIPVHSWKDCMFKWLNMQKVNLKDSQWKSQESQFLKKLVTQNQTDQIRWNSIAQKLYFMNSDENQYKIFRNAKQCKQHWNLMNMSAKAKNTPWTCQEDILLLKTLKQNHVKKSWSLISTLFYGRSQNAVKNRFNLILAKQKKQAQGGKNEMEMIQSYLSRCMFEKYTKIIEVESEEEGDGVKFVRK